MVECGLVSCNKKYQKQKNGFKINKGKYLKYYRATPYILITPPKDPDQFLKDYIFQKSSDLEKT